MKLAQPIEAKTPRITSTFSSKHKGLDYGYTDGTPVYASQSGTVIHAKNGEKRSWIANTPSDPYKPATGTRALTNNDYGNMIVIEHSEGFVTLYAHLKYMSNHVVAGDKVLAGQMISQVGSTGNSTGNHTHYEVTKDGVKVDPTLYIDPTFTPYFYTPGGGEPMTTISEAELTKIRDDRDKNHNDRMALYEALGFSGDFNRTIALEKIEMMNKLEKVIREKDVLLTKVQEDLQSLQNLLSQAKKDVEELQVKNQNQSVELEKQKVTIDGLGEEVTRLKKETINQNLDWWKSIVNTFVKLFVRK